MKRLTVLITLLLLCEIGLGADIALEWDANPPAQNVAEYIVYASVNGGPVQELARVAGPSPVPCSDDPSKSCLAFTDTRAPDSGTITYTVTAANTFGESPPSSPVSIDTALPSAPLNLRITITISVTSSKGQ